MSCLGICPLLFGTNFQINGHSYRLVRRIGEGGFSYVELVQRQSHRYALKRMLIQLPEQKELSENEIRTHQLVQHRNIIDLVESQIRPSGGHGNSIAYLLFPYYRNGTLQDLMEQERRRGHSLPEQRVLKLILSVCRALSTMHKCASGPIAHRDVKPGNLLLTDSGDELVLMDLGSATDAVCYIRNRQEAIALQERAAQSCTAQYRAPELFEVPSECTITAKTDVWSLGCTLYAAAFGSSPCDGSALSAMSGRITFPKQHHYTQRFCELVDWILTVDTTERPEIAEVEERIQNLLQT